MEAQTDLYERSAPHKYVRQQLRASLLGLPPPPVQLPLPVRVTHHSQAWRVVQNVKERTEQEEARPRAVARRVESATRDEARERERQRKEGRAAPRRVHANKPCEGEGEKGERS